MHVSPPCRVTLLQVANGLHAEDGSVCISTYGRQDCSRQRFFCAAQDSDRAVSITHTRDSAWAHG